MKKLISFITLVFTTSTFAGYSKPELLMRTSDADAWKVPANTWCFFSEPTMTQNFIYIPCFDSKGNFMARLTDQFEIIARADDDQQFSKVVESFGKAHWYEYTEFGAVRSFTVEGKVTETPLGDLSNGMDFNSSFLPLKNETWFYLLKGEVPKLMKWKNGKSEEFFNPKASFIFSPQVGNSGEVALKTRYDSTSENSPDKLWHYNGSEWKVILEDHDANPASTWISFRHQLSVDGNRVLTIATDKEGEALIAIEGEKIEIIARIGLDLKEFDYFTVKIRGNTVAFRGVDFKNRKAVYVHSEGKLTQLITQDDIIQTDKGPARIHYQSQDAIFYGAPSIGPHGEILQQVTLTDPDYPSTLLGVGLIKVQK